jgi:hypothetical protein
MGEFEIITLVLGVFCYSILSILWDGFSKIADKFID